MEKNWRWKESRNQYVIIKRQNGYAAKLKHFPMNWKPILRIQIGNLLLICEAILDSYWPLGNWFFIHLFFFEYKNQGGLINDIGK